MAFSVYLLRCSDGRYYTGHTDDLDRRMAEHQIGGMCDFTSRRRPVTLAWSEYFQTRVEAREAERIVGGWFRAKKEALIRRDWGTVSLFARPPRERFSTSLETNGKVESGDRGLLAHPTPFVSSEVEKRSPMP